MADELTDAMRSALAILRSDPAAYAMRANRPGFAGWLRMSSGPDRPVLDATLVALLHKGLLVRKGIMLILPSENSRRKDLRGGP